MKNAMKINIFIIILSFLFIRSSFSYEKQLNENPDEGLNFKPFIAYTIEPRLGFINRLNINNVRLDIGASYDLLKFEPLKFFKMAFGTDFFTYTKLRKENDFKFPVETIDYLFGVNYSLKYAKPDNDFIYSLRIRLSHISAHLVDGFADSNLFKKTPFVYSREFFDISFAFEIDFIRFYLSSDFIFHSIPDVFSSINPHIGLDFRYPLSIFELIGGYDFKLSHINNESYKAHSAQLGLSYKLSKIISFFLGAYYYNGNSIHGLFYNENDEYFGLGFQFIYN